MREIILYEDLISAAERDGWRLFRMLDLAGKMPFDLIGWRCGRCVGVEVKMERRLTGLAVDAPMPSSWWTQRRHQLGHLRDLANARGVALIMVYRCDHKAGGWTMLRVPQGLDEGCDLRMLPVSMFSPVEVAVDLSDWSLRIG